MKRMEEVSASPAEEGEAVLEEEGTGLPGRGLVPGSETGRRPFTPVQLRGQIVTDATTPAPSAITA